MMAPGGGGGGGWGVGVHSRSGDGLPGAARTGSQLYPEFFLGLVVAGGGTCSFLPLWGGCGAPFVRS